ncbi:hypothetical protein Cme02nite_51780 [Catellatospora methionotrophica]|uniref:Lipoprotein n=1 Tax=Catellatospora methionotrophica TaxID=121620 RepID=A0A8J3PGJ4_9ACTN|nr:hypothetical protein [Catellatospora methionotrophica]GIG16846.1 hypothetical protein Cme02nite_51780 [Catellatospora methionotrophica]
MRRILATATLGLALFGAAACADTQPEATGTPTPGAAATSAAAPAGVDKKTACANLTKAGNDFKTQGAVILPEMMNPATQQAAVPKLTKLLTDFQAAYSKDVSTIADAELKAAVESDLKALQTAATAVVAANGDAAKIEAALSSPEFTSAGEKVETLCKA